MKSYFFPISTKSSRLCLLTLLLIVTSLIFALPAFAQAQPAKAQPAKESSKEGGEPSLKEAGIDEQILETYSYLDRQNAQRRLEDRINRSRDSLYLLQKLVHNFGSEVNDSTKDLDRIKDLYRIALAFYYRQKSLESYLTLDKVAEGSKELFKKFSEKYKDKSQGILSRCADYLVQVDLNRSSGDSTPMNAAESDDFMKDQFKLKMAYQQMALAETRIREERFDSAIEHYRLAKLYGIKVLKGLERDKEKVKAMDEQYRIDLIDALGGVRQDARKQ